MELMIFFMSAIALAQTNSSIVSIASSSTTFTRTLSSITTLPTATSGLEALTYNCTFTFTKELPHNIQKDKCPRELVYNNDTVTVNVYYKSKMTNRIASSAIFSIKKNGQTKTPVTLYTANSTEFDKQEPQSLKFLVDPKQWNINTSQISDPSNEFIIFLQMIFQEVDPNTSVTTATTIRGPVFAIRSLDFQMANFSRTVGNSMNSSSKPMPSETVTRIINISSKPTQSSSGSRLYSGLSLLALLLI